MVERCAPRKGPGLQLTAQERDLVVIKGKSFKPSARGVPAVKAQTSVRAWTQGRSAPGSATGINGGPCTENGGGGGIQAVPSRMSLALLALRAGKRF